jgi:hypothetical protein
LPITRSGICSVVHTQFCNRRKIATYNEFLCKYADDKTFIVPDICLEGKFKHVVQWPVQNKLVVNLTENKEMVFHRSGLCRFIATPPLVDIERVSTFKLLGVYIAGALSMERHINYILFVVNQRLYLASNFVHLSFYSFFKFF